MYPSPVCVCRIEHMYNVWNDVLQVCLYVDLYCNSWLFASFSINFCTYEDFRSIAPNLSASLIDTEQTPKRQKGTHDGTDIAAVGDILMEYSSD